jgi:hypothetical protein
MADRKVLNQTTHSGLTVGIYRDSNGVYFELSNEQGGIYRARKSSTLEKTIAVLSEDYLKSQEFGHFESSKLQNENGEEFKIRDFCELGSIIAYLNEFLLYLKNIIRRE